MLSLLKQNIYPAWRHHRNGEAMIVKTLEHDASLNDDWADCPLAFEVMDAEPEEIEEVVAVVIPEVEAIEENSIPAPVLDVPVKSQVEEVIAMVKRRGRAKK